MADILATWLNEEVGLSKVRSFFTLTRFAENHELRAGLRKWLPPGRAPLQVQSAKRLRTLLDQVSDHDKVVTVQRHQHSSNEELRKAGANAAQPEYQVRFYQRGQDHEGRARLRPQVAVLAQNGP